MAPLLSRKRDMLYLFFFIIHVPIMLNVDLAPMYPDSIKPTYIANIQTYYRETYKDKFFFDPPSWFTAYVAMELFYHVPLSFWAVGALIKDKPSVPLHLLVWAVQTTITTLTCLVEVWGWDHINTQEKITLSQLYGPYLVFAAGMALDMFFRLQKKLGLAAAGRSTAAGTFMEKAKAQ